MANAEQGTLAMMWDSFRRKVIPADAGPEQIRDLKGAFYGGATVVIAALEISSELPENLGALMIAGVSREIDEFKRGFKASEPP